MKKLLLSIALLAPFFGRSQSFTTVTVQDSISSDTHWTCDKQYFLKGYVYVTTGATLTIDSGTIIRGDLDTKGTLIIERGAKLRAMGSVTKPIVFTSNQAAGTRNYGDWGGVVLCGKSPTNWSSGQGQVEGGPRSFYGGTDPHDNSGEMHYVRIEYAGVALTPNNEINGLTFCSVGDATQIDHIQVSYSGDDSYEWFGGTVNCKYLVSVGAWDDDFDTDNGYQGKVQFGAILRDPGAADQSGSKGFESDSYQTGTYSGMPADNSKMTRPIFSNVTCVGPMINPTTTSYNNQFVSGLHIRRGSALSVLNSVIMGWPEGVLLDESSSSFGSTSANIASTEMQVRNNLIAGMPVFPTTSTRKDAMYVFNGARSLTSTNANNDTTSTAGTWMGTPFAGPSSWLWNAPYGNKGFANAADARLTNPFNLSNPNMLPLTTSPISYRTWTSNNGAVTLSFNPAMPISYDTTGDSIHFNVPAVEPNFSTSKASDAFFTPTNYVGAFAGTGLTSANWMKQWTNFDPNNTNYEVTCYVAPVDNAVSDINKASFGISKVFPNPAREQATLLLDVKESSSIRVTIGDVTGKIVAEVFNGELAAGTQSIAISTANLTNGIYTVTVSSSVNTKTLKLSIVK
jgi:hypothetical protein